jgi:hypothetical protein
MKLLVQGYSSDRGGMDVWKDTYDYPGVRTIKGLMKRYMMEERDVDEDGWKEILDMIKTGRWVGGEYTMVNKNCISYVTDVAEEEFRLIR